jgi:hypothetical protein
MVARKFPLRSQSLKTRSVLFLVCLKMWDTSNLDKNHARLIKHQIGRGNRLSDPCTTVDSGGGDHQCSTSQPWLKAMAVKAALQEVETPLVCHSAWVQILGALEVHAYVSGIITIQIEIDRNNIKYNPNIYAISFLCICGQAQGHGIRCMSCYTYCLPGILIDVLRVLGQWSGMRMSPSQMLIYFTGRCYGIERNCL